MCGGEHYVNCEHLFPWQWSSGTAKAAKNIHVIPHKPRKYNGVTQQATTLIRLCDACEIEFQKNIGILEDCPQIDDVESWLKNVAKDCKHAKENDFMSISSFLLR